MEQLVQIYIISGIFAGIFIIPKIDLIHENIKSFLKNKYRNPTKKIIIFYTYLSVFCVILIPVLNTFQAGVGLLNFALTVGKSE